jgi:hypothetical protein
VGQERSDPEDFLNDDYDSSADDGSLHSLLKDFEYPKRKATSTKPEAEPAWRRLEKFKERQHTQALTEDFDDYDLD